MKNELTDGTGKTVEVLIADDDATIRRSYRLLFEQEGYGVRTARNGEEALRLYEERRPAVLLLDVMMPKMNGITVCQEIRQRDPFTPILFFTALPSEVSLVRGLGCGADDYIDKTRPPEEFLARVGAALRRQARMQTQKTADQVVLGGARIDCRELSVTSEIGISHLTKSEIIALNALLNKRGKLVTYEEFFTALGGEGYSGTDESVRKTIRRLKMKIGRGGAMIVVERGLGFRLMG